MGTRNPLFSSYLQQYTVIHTGLLPHIRVRVFDRELSILGQFPSVHVTTST